MNCCHFLSQFHLSQLGIGLVFLCGPSFYMVSSFAAGKLSDLFVSSSVFDKVLYFIMIIFIGSQVFHCRWIYCQWDCFRFPWASPVCNYR